MKRLFYSDYGEDPARTAKMEAVLKDLRMRGVEVCRTSRKPLNTAALNLTLPNLIERSMKGAGVTLHPDVKPDEWPLTLHAATFRYDHPKKSAQDCYTSMYMYRQHIEQELEHFDPDIVLLWHQFNAYHGIIADWCKARDVPVIYGEHGVLPGSWCFEFGGQMGESWIARDPATFQALPIDDNDLDKARGYLAQAVETGMNRKAPGLTAAATGLAEQFAADPRPKILYAGVNDYKTGLQPFSKRRTMRHAGDFISTSAGLAALLPLARKNGWHILYKPHPSIKHEDDALSAYRDCLSVVDKRVDLIDLLQYCDALATIVSQSAYMALMHDTPAILMGRMQLSGSGRVQAALFARDLESAITTALAKPDPEAHRARLLEHIARLMRYYVIADTHGERGLFRHDLSGFAPSLMQLDSMQEDVG